MLPPAKRAAWLKRLAVVRHTTTRVAITLLLAGLICNMPAEAKPPGPMVLKGPARAIDGDTLEVGVPYPASWTRGCTMRSA